MIYVVDAIMGKGKSTLAIKMMNTNLEQNYLYITPFLDEVDRIKTHVNKRQMCDPKHSGKGKLSSLNNLLMAQEDIAATHELFKHVDHYSYELFKNGQYILILDEVLDVIEPYTEFKKNDYDLLFDSGTITVDADGYIVWNADKMFYDTKYNIIKNLAQNHSLLYVNGKILCWKYPAETFSHFKDIYILTYMFEASILKYYFDVEGINYEKLTIENGELVPYKAPDCSVYKELIDIYDGPLNNISKKKNALSSTWFDGHMKTNTAAITKLSNNVYNYLRNIKNAPSKDILWTTYKKSAGKLKQNGYARRFLSYNCKSTNMYANTKVLVYALNVYVHPGIISYFDSKGVKMDQELYALGIMLQWIWRSQIRNGKPISIYIPADRMRSLLQLWLGNLVSNHIEQVY